MVTTYSVAARATTHFLAAVDSISVTADQVKTRSMVVRSCTVSPNIEAVRLFGMEANHVCNPYPSNNAQRSRGRALESCLGKPPLCADRAGFHRETRF